MDLKLTPTTNDLMKANGGAAPPMPAGLTELGPTVAFADPASTGPTLEEARKGRILDPSKPLRPFPNEWDPPDLGAEGEGPARVRSPSLNEIPLEPKLERPVRVISANPGLQPLKVAIVGTAPSSRGLAPVGDPSWQIWACSAGNMGQLARVDVWFELHATLLTAEHRAWGEPYIKWLNSQTFPVYAIDQTQIARAIPYPKDQMIEKFGRFFFTSSFAWMMALAIDMGAQQIGLFGVDMASSNEYILQRAGGHYFCLEASRRGIAVIAPPESDILTPPPLYGFCDNTPFGRKTAARDKEMRERLAFHQQQAQIHQQQAIYLQGALEDNTYMRSIWASLQG